MYFALLVKSCLRQDARAAQEEATKARQTSDYVKAILVRQGFLEMPVFRDSSLFGMVDDEIVIWPNRMDTNGTFNSTDPLQPLWTCRRRCVPWVTSEAHWNYAVMPPPRGESKPRDSLSIIPIDIMFGASAVVPTEDN